MRCNTRAKLTRPLVIPFGYTLPGMYEAPIELRNIKGGGQKSGRRVAMPIDDAFFLIKKSKLKKPKTIARTNTLLGTSRRSCKSQHARKDAVSYNSDHYCRTEKYRTRYKIEDPYSKEPQLRQREELPLLGEKPIAPKKTFNNALSICTTTL